MLLVTMALLIDTQRTKSAVNITSPHKLRAAFSRDSIISYSFFINFGNSIKSNKYFMGHLLSPIKLQWMESNLF